MFSFKKYMKKEKSKVSDTTTTEDVITEINEHIAKKIGWKYLKSQKCMKNTLGKLVFEIRCYSSKWNISAERVEVNWEFRLWTKEYDKISNVNSIVCHYSYRDKDNDWYNITTEQQFKKVSHIVIEEIKNTAVFFYEQFEKDYLNAVRLLGSEDYFQKFHVQLDFLADNLGIDAIREIAKKEYEGYPDSVKQEIEQYRSGEETTANWTINRCNTRYIADNNLM